MVDLPLPGPPSSSVSVPCTVHSTEIARVSAQADFAVYMNPILEEDTAAKYICSFAVSMQGGQRQADLEHFK